MEINDEVIIFDYKGNEIGTGIIVKLSSKISNKPEEYKIKNGTNYAERAVIIPVEKKLSGYTELFFTAARNDRYFSKLAIAKHYNLYHTEDMDLFYKYVQPKNVTYKFDKLLNQIEKICK